MSKQQYFSSYLKSYVGKKHVILKLAPPPPPPTAYTASLTYRRNLAMNRRFSYNAYNSLNITICHTLS